MASVPHRRRSASLRIRVTPEEKRQIESDYLASGAKTLVDYLKTRETIVLRRIDTQAVAALSSVAAALYATPAELRSLKDEMTNLCGAVGKEPKRLPILQQVQGLVQRIERALVSTELANAPLREQLASVIRTLVPVGDP